MRSCGCGGGTRRGSDTAFGEATMVCCGFDPGGRGVCVWRRVAAGHRWKDRGVLVEWVGESRVELRSAAYVSCLVSHSEYVSIVCCKGNSSEACIGGGVKLLGARCNSCRHRRQLTTLSSILFHPNTQYTTLDTMATQHRSLDGKIGVVTGAARGIQIFSSAIPALQQTNISPGIGAGIATNLASKGCNLILNYTSESSEERCTKLASTLASTHNIKAYAVRADSMSLTDHHPPLP